MSRYTGRFASGPYAGQVYEYDSAIFHRCDPVELRVLDYRDSPDPRAHRPYERVYHYAVDEAGRSWWVEA